MVMIKDEELKQSKTKAQKLLDIEKKKEKEKLEKGTHHWVDYGKTKVLEKKE